MDTPKKQSSKLNKQDIVITFIQMLNTVKLYHWKTYSYAKHEATDMLYKDLNKYVDEFVEVMLGKYGGRIPNFDISLALKNSESAEKMKKTIFGYRTFLTGLNDVLHKEKDSDLLNIRDEILGALNQFMYLFSFNK